MPSSTRWKLACAVLAAVTGYTTFADRSHANTPAPSMRARSAALPLALLRPLRVSPEAAGVSREALIERVLAARSLREITLLTDRLGALGDDETIDRLSPLLGDPRRGVPEAILACFGAIGTQYAVELLIEHTDDDRPAARLAAIAALSTTRSAPAEARLVELAQRNGDPGQGTAVAALGALGSDTAVDVLRKLAESGDSNVGSNAVTALGAIDSGAATAALRALIDSPNPPIAAAALGAIDVIDEPLLAKLSVLVRAGDLARTELAIQALVNAGDAALPVLRAAARDGVQDVRRAAVSAIGALGGSPAVIGALGDLLVGDDRMVATMAAAALADLGGKEARELLINTALGDRGVTSGALGVLGNLTGDDVDQALLTVMRSGSSSERRAALPRLLRAGNRDAMAFAIDLARNGSANEQIEAIRLLTEQGSPEAMESVFALAGQPAGRTRQLALAQLAEARPGDPSVQRLFRDVLLTGRPDEATYAANTLAQIGGDAARDALLAALATDNEQLVEAAAVALGGFALTEPVKQALTSAAQTIPGIGDQLMTRLLNAGDPEGVRLAEAAIASDDPDVMRTALGALTETRGGDARRLLERAAASSNPQVRAEAATALSGQSDDRTAETLIRMTRDSEPGVRTTALQALGRLGSERAQQVLFGAASSGTSDERRVAIEVLSGINDSAVSSQLIRLVRDPEPEIVLRAIDALQHGGADVDRALIELVRDPTTRSPARMAAAAQLRRRNTGLDPTTDAMVSAATQYSGAKVKTVPYVEEGHLEEGNLEEGNLEDVHEIPEIY